MSLIGGLVTIAVLAGCSAPPVLSARDGRVQVVTTTGLLRDLVQNVGGDRVNVTSLVPDGGDPHSYEPSLRDVRNVVYADVAFSNYVMLEEHNIIKTLDANLDEDARNVSLAEDAVKYAAEIIPLVEDVSLDTVWLGLRARGDGAKYGANRASDVLLSATKVTGPGAVFGYLTGSFGDTDIYFNSSDGFDAGNGFRDDTATLPADAHTHMSWVFTKPGIYKLTLAARLQVDQQAKPVPLGEATFTVAVGVPPSESGVDGAVVLDRGHADLTVDLDRDEVYALYDPQGGGESSQIVVPAGKVVIDVPNTALDEVPAGGQYSFLGRAGDRIYQLPQAVLGKHVHGEIDPHLWQNVRNAMSYVEVIRDALIERDPEGARTYRRNATAYLAELDALDRYVRDRIAGIPDARRYLVTTHDAFGYLADAYGVKIAGFVTPNPATEPSLADRRKLTDTIRNLRVPAVFLEPNLAARSSTLTEVAEEQGVRVCSIYGDTFDGDVTTYVQMMRFNADSLRECLG
ncbi:anchored repeat ABC transporter, substrate-binding protein [Kibdelosporangium persicum]|uniref:Periplasmic zinc-binding protein TroA n=1 Tax=Kibdelosporangium persicum TaxID=2698649 RepID=A0ABX2FDL9_9PSEU|nr:anchored repeat ABC transporter, substrate-binding protein [Kibdelosporangium persicum]NRN69461.1 Periplasmic zinc-binding protein TroA [Kibdelosporangium persicum]